jgi:hypothetical protein
MIRYFLPFIVSIFISYSLAAQTSSQSLPYADFENQYKQDSSETVLQEKYRVAFNNRLQQEFFWLDSLLNTPTPLRKIAQLRGDKKKVMLQFEYTDVLQEYASKTSELDKRSVSFVLLMMQLNDNVLYVLQPGKSDTVSTQYPNIKKALEQGRLQLSVYVVMGINVQQLPPTKLKPVDLSKRSVISESEYKTRSSEVLESIRLFIQKNPKLINKGFSVESYLQYEQNKSIQHPYDQWVYRENFLVFLQEKNKE